MYNFNFYNGHLKKVISLKIHSQKVMTFEEGQLPYDVSRASQPYLQPWDTIYSSGLPSNSFLSSTFINHAAAPSISTLNPVNGEPSCNSALKTRQTDETIYTSIEIAAAPSWLHKLGLQVQVSAAVSFLFMDIGEPPRRHRSMKWASLFLGSLLVMAAKTRTLSMDETMGR